MIVTPLTTELVEAYVDFRNAVAAVDAPGTAPIVPADTRTGSAGSPDFVNQWLLWRDGDDIVGHGYLGHATDPADPTVFLGGSVRPDRRRRGLGRRILTLLTERCRAAGRGSQIAAAVEPVRGGPFRDDAGYRFLAAQGFHSALDSVALRLDLAEADPEREKALYESARRLAGNHRLLSWTGPTPEEHLAEVARLRSAGINTIPRGELDYPEERITPDRIRRDEAELADRGHETVTTVVRHLPTGRLVARSVIEFPVGSQYAHQGVTYVAPDHRGHRLGLMTKLANHRLLRRHHPTVRWVDTTNADGNAPMQAINRRLGFVALERNRDMQRRLS